MSIHARSGPLGRVGGWRIVARIEDDVLRVLVLRTVHRREVYR